MLATTLAAVAATVDTTPAELVDAAAPPVAALLEPPVAPEPPDRSEDEPA